MSVEISENYRNFLHKVALKQGFENYTLTLDNVSLKGENYLGNIISVKITENSNGKNLNLVLKIAPKGDALREKMPVEIVYNREFFVYSEIFNEFSDLLKQFEIGKLLEITAKFYGGLMEPNNEFLVLENLSQNGFKMWNRKETMDFQHVSIAMKQYGKLHGFSYVLRKFRPEKFEEITEKLTPVFDGRFSEEQRKKSFISLMQKVSKAVSGNMKALLGLRRFMEISQVFLNETVNVKDKYSVIMHVDCWCNNMMFKYGENLEEPSEIRLIDWQLSKIGNPVMDLSYFFYTSASKSCMDDYKKFLKIYHDSLTETLSLFGLHSMDVMTYEELEEQWCIYAKYGMYIAFLVIRIMLSEKEEAQDLSVLAEEGKTYLDLFEFEILNNGEYNRRVNIILDHMVKNQLI